MSSDNVTEIVEEFINPATQTPLFTAEWLTCAYPVSDIYASTPRYLYYSLLVLVLLTQWHSWLANVFLGIVATYAGTAAIEALILITNKTHAPAAETVTIPYVSSASVSGNSTLSSITNLVTDTSQIDVRPAALEFDVDAVLAITVTGYLMMLPMHCWSSAVRANRARHLLILMWNALMFAGMLCSVILWPTLFNSSLQYRFCYPTMLDSTSVTSNGRYTNNAATQLDGTWNETIWKIFSNFTRAAQLSENCFYPCFNTTQIMRRSSTLVADLQSTNKSPRLSVQLLNAGVAWPTTNVWREASLADAMYTALIVTTVVMLFLLVLVLTPLGRITRVPIHKPKDVLWSSRKELYHALCQDFIRIVTFLARAVSAPRATERSVRNSPSGTVRRNAWETTRFFLDLLALVLLFMAMIVTPAVIVIFVVFIEWYIHRDLVSSEAPQQVGQWTSLVSLALVLISALVLRLRYLMAGRGEVEDELSETHDKASQLEALLLKKEIKEENRRSRAAAKAESNSGSGISDARSVEMTPADPT